MMNNTTDVNQASCDDLLMLPGITLAQAKRIMSYLEKHNGFQTKEEFLDYLPSIGVLPQYYVKIEPLVHVIPLPPTWMKETSSSMPKSTRILDL